MRLATTLPPTSSVISKAIVRQVQLITAVRVHHPNLRHRIAALSFPVAAKQESRAISRPPWRIIIPQHVSEPKLVRAVGIHQIDFFVCVNTSPGQNLSVIIGFLPRLNNTISRADKCDHVPIRRPNGLIINHVDSAKCQPHLIGPIYVHDIDGNFAKMIAATSKPEIPQKNYAIRLSKSESVLLHTSISTDRLLSADYW